MREARSSGRFMQTLARTVDCGWRTMRRAALLDVMNAPKAPAMLFTASHGMAVDSGDPRQKSDQGALLCQDWSGFGDTRPEHFLTAADIGDDANVNGLIAFTFACFGAGTPDADQFLKDLSDTAEAPPMAPSPFVAALPQRLLGHPNGSALAVIGHVDRAWGCSIKTPHVSDAQIGTFRNTIGNVLTGTPVGHAVSGAFGARFAVLSTALASATSPSAPAGGRLSDRDLGLHWLERNDAQNYVVSAIPRPGSHSNDSERKTHGPTDVLAVSEDVRESFQPVLQALPRSAKRWRASRTSSVSVPDTISRER